MHNNENNEFYGTEHIKSVKQHEEELRDILGSSDSELDSINSVEEIEHDSDKEIQYQSDKDDQHIHLNTLDNFIVNDSGSENDTDNEFQPLSEEEEEDECEYADDDDLITSDDDEVITGVQKKRSIENHDYTEYPPEKKICIETKASVSCVMEEPHRHIPIQSIHVPVVHEVVVPCFSPLRETAFQTEFPYHELKHHPVKHQTHCEKQLKSEELVSSFPSLSDTTVQVCVRSEH
jgi:hypothetical protein